MKKKKSIGNAGETIIVQEKSGGGGSGIVLPLIILGVVGTAGVVGYKAWSKTHDEKETEKANNEIIAHTANIKKIDAAIAKTEGNTFANGVNSFGKTVNINLITQVKEAINSFYSSTTDKYGTTTYHKKIKENGEVIDEAKIKSAIFNTPLNAVEKFGRLYNAYTGKSFIDDSQNLSSALYKQIKVIFEVAHNKAGVKKPVKGLGTAYLVM